jgi:hypothetical protein
LTGALSVPNALPATAIFDMLSRNGGCVTRVASGVSPINDGSMATDCPDITSMQGASQLKSARRLLVRPRAQIEPVGAM